MAITINAKGTSVPYFKIGKSGVTLYQGATDPHTTDGFSVRANDIWIDTTDKTLKFRTPLNTWEALSTVNSIADLEDVDLTGLANGYVLKYNSLSQMWEPSQTTGGLASDWGSIAENPIDYDGYTGDVWQLNTSTSTVSYANNVSIGGNLSVTGNAVISGNLTFGDTDTDTIALTADINSNLIPETNATYNLGSSTQQWNNTFISGTIDNSANTGAMVFPTGTIAQRPASPVQGMVRFNSETTRFEGYNGTQWINIDIPDDWGSVAETP
jgi:hypothetical protein